MVVDGEPALGVVEDFLADASGLVLDPDLERDHRLLDIRGYTPRLDDVVRVEPNPDLDVLAADTIIVPVDQPLLRLACERGQIAPVLIAHGLPGVQIFRSLVGHDVAVEQVSPVIVGRVEVAVLKVEDVPDAAVGAYGTVAVDYPAQVVGFPGVGCHEKGLAVPVGREVLPDQSGGNQPSILFGSRKIPRRPSLTSTG